MTHFVMEEVMQHTPGDWFWNGYDAIWAGKGDDSERIASVAHLEYDAEGDEVPSHGDEIFGPRRAEARANAELMAAAPKLLKALVLVAPLVESHITHGNVKVRGIETGPALEVVRAAIKEASNSGGNA